MTSDSEEQVEQTETKEEPQNQVAEEAIPETSDKASESSHTKLVCVECGGDYFFSEKQQKEYAAKGYQTPKRCPKCRQNRRNRNSNQNQRRSRGGRGPRRRMSSPPPQRNTNENLPPEQNSYVAQAEYYKTHKQSPPAKNQPTANPGDKENFGNSIHYDGPGVDPRFGTARVGSPQFAPWEGAHGFLLTSHEPELKRRKNEKDKKNPRSKRHQKNDRQNTSGRGGQRGRNKGFKKRRRTFEIVCMECSITTQVPFKPIPGKPVYCQECYKKSKSKPVGENIEASSPVDEAIENPMPPSGDDSPEGS